jgi:hypothetical protein
MLLLSPCPWASSAARVLPCDSISRCGTRVYRHPSVPNKKPKAVLILLDRKQTPMYDLHVTEYAIEKCESETANPENLVMTSDPRHPTSPRNTGKSHGPHTDTLTGSIFFSRLRLLRRPAPRNDRVRAEVGDPIGAKELPAYPVFPHSIIPFTRPRPGAWEAIVQNEPNFGHPVGVPRRIVQNEPNLACAPGNGRGLARPRCSAGV